MHEHDASLSILLLLGAAHGLNPAMGWLFAVSLGLQEQRRRAVWRAFGPLALGHGLAIVVALAGVAIVGVVVPAGVLKWVVAVALVAMGILQLMGHRHPLRGGMRVDAKDLTVWSFLMASAHGAGLMAVPFMMDGVEGMNLHRGHSGGGVVPGGGPAAAIRIAGFEGMEPAVLLGTALHTIGYLVVAALIAVVVYEKLGVRLLRKAWINLNLIWAAALIVTGLLTPLL